VLTVFKTLSEFVRKNTKLYYVCCLVEFTSYTQYTEMSIPVYLIVPKMYLSTDVTKSVVAILQLLYAEFGHEN